MVEELDAVFIGAEHEEEAKSSPRYRACLMREISTQTARPPKSRKPNSIASTKGGKKTEEKDKFWLRAFRSAMKKNFHRIKKELATGDRSFWREYLSKEGEPGKTNRFSSYSRSYKDHLFGRPGFVLQFRKWLEKDGLQELENKHSLDTEPDTYRVLLEYAREVLAVYQVDMPSRAN